MRSDNEDGGFSGIKTFATLIHECRKEGKTLSTQDEQFILHPMTPIECGVCRSFAEIGVLYEPCTPFYWCIKCAISTLY